MRAQSEKTVQKAIAEGVVKRIEVGRENASLIWSLATLGIVRASRIEMEWLDQLFGDSIEVDGIGGKLKTFYIVRSKDRLIIQSCTLRSATLENFRYSLSLVVSR